jgi:hypothetical protein
LATCCHARRVSRRFTYHLVGPGEQRRGHVEATSLAVGSVPTNWQIVGTGDFNGDSKSDILWRDTNSGGVAIWFMNGATLTSAVGIGAVPTTWTIAGTGDFDGDGVSEILWHDNSGATPLWLMRPRNSANCGPGCPCANRLGKTTPHGLP